MAADTPTRQVHPAAMAAASVWRIAAEGLRLAGECGDAAKLYDGLAGELEPVDDETAVARRRAAECRLAFGEIDAALRVIADCRSLAGALPAQLAVRITDVCSEVTVDVEERCADPDPDPDPDAGD